MLASRQRRKGTTITAVRASAERLFDYTQVTSSSAGPRVINVVTNIAVKARAERLFDYTQVASSSVGPRVISVVTNAVIKVQRTTQCRNEPVEPRAGSGLVLA